MEYKQYDSVIGGKYLLALAYQKDIVLSVTKVQKLLYIIYSHVLVKYNRILFLETPKALPYGPVFPKTRVNIDFGKVYKINDSELYEIEEEPELENIFNKVIDKYYKYSASQLSEWSHLPESPWDKTRKLQNFKWGDTIPDQFIKDYFQKYTII